MTLPTTGTTLDVGQDLPRDATVASFASLDEAYRAVEQLAEGGFDILGTEIAWSGLHRVEHVTGRRSVGRAAVDGAVVGLWFGLLLGVLSAWFVDSRRGGGVLALVGAYTVLGALVGMVWGFIAQHWTGAHRSVVAFGTLRADRYDLRVPPGERATAMAILGITGRRPVDPPAADVDDTPPRRSPR